MIFLRDLHFGFLPDDCEDEFNDCFDRIGKVCLTPACLSIHLSICLFSFLSVYNYFFWQSVCMYLHLSDLHFGFLLDDCEDEFNNCFNRIGKVHLPVCTSVSLFICLSIYIFYLSIFPFVFLTVCPSVPPPVCLIFILDFCRLIVRTSLTIASTGLERYICLPACL
jgi:hypothetical protein